MINTIRVDKIFAMIAYQQQILELRLMRHRVRQAAKQLRPIEALFYRMNQPIPHNHPASKHFGRLHPVEAQYLAEIGAL